MRVCLSVAASILALSAACTPPNSTPDPTPTPTPTPTWNVAINGDVLEASYGLEGKRPQYVALHLDSGYLRLNTGPTSGWGTSIVVLPSVWTGGKLVQGARVMETHTIGDDLVLNIKSQIAGLSVTGDIRIHPPAEKSIKADVRMATSGTVTLDARACEAFKPLMLSSMHISATQWDTQGAEIEGKQAALPAQGWIVQPPCPQGNNLTLSGGTSSWKTNAPTIAVTLEGSALGITGWVTTSTSTDSDNVGLWAAADRVLPSWSYSITARQ